MCSQVIVLKFIHLMWDEGQAVLKQGVSSLTLCVSPAWQRDGADKDRAKHFMMAGDLPGKPY